MKVRVFVISSGRSGVVGRANRFRHQSDYVSASRRVENPAAAEQQREQLSVLLRPGTGHLHTITQCLLNQFQLVWKRTPYSS